MMIDEVHVHTQDFEKWLHCSCSIWSAIYTANIPLQWTCCGGEMSITRKYGHKQNPPPLCLYKQSVQLSLYMHASNNLYL